MVDPKPTIKNADMPEEVQQEAVECAVRAFEKYSIEKDIAAFIKKEFDKKYGVTWHCIVGRNFGSYVTHGMFIFSTSPLLCLAANVVVVGLDTHCCDSLV